MNHNANGFLDALELRDFEQIRPHLKIVTLAHGDMLGETGTPIEQIYFPHSGLISIVVALETGDRIEAAVAGRSGLCGVSAGLGVPVHLNTAIVQMPGVASVIAADQFARAASESESLRTLAFRHTHFMLAQGQQSAACNARHHIPQRLCAWLLRVRDAAGTDELSLTQEFLAQMLGVQRPSVSLVAAELQNRGLIRYRRGDLHITDLEGLKANACECYQAVRKQYERLFHIELNSSAARGG